MFYKKHIYQLVSWGNRLILFCSWLAIISLVILVLLTVVDIIGRTIHLFYLPGYLEIAIICILLLAYFGLALCIKNHGNISVDLFTTYLSDRANRLIDAGWLLLFSICFLILAYYCGHYAFKLHDMGKTTTNWEWSVLAYYLPTTIGLGFSGILGLIVSINDISLFFRGKHRKISR